MFSDRIRDFAAGFDVDELIRRYDVDFDVPLHHEYAIGVLRMRGVFQPVARGGDPWAVARRVGAHWCDLVRSDVLYDHWHALQMIEASQGDVARLAGQLKAGDQFLAYVLARWHDATGKIRYRMAGFSRSRLEFEQAVRIADAHDLWWCLPDLRSNLHRARYEESRQGAAPAVGTLIDVLRAERERVAGDAARHGVAIGAIDPAGEPTHREFLRGYSSILHNLALALKAGDADDESMLVSRESLRISRALGDFFRIVQSENHQALLDHARAPAIWAELTKAEYVRGRLIARQRLAAHQGGLDGARALRALLQELIDAAAASGGAALDRDAAAFTMDLYADAVDHLPAEVDAAVRAELVEDVAAKRLSMAETIRRAVALPAYKQAYAKTIRPSYLERIADRLAGASAEEAFGLVEASSARELLDMLSAAALPELPLPPSTGTAVKRDVPASAVQAGVRRTLVRRSGLRRAPTDQAPEMTAELSRRETEYEEAFLHQPLEAAPHDPEIAHRVRMYSVNNPGTCLVRYFTYGRARPESLGAYVFRDGDMQCVTGIPYADVERLAAGLTTGEAPAASRCEEIWNVLIRPVWDLVRTAEPDHLVLVPTDDLFAVPLHVAWEPGAAMPLAALLPMSQSVSATAFVTRGRNFLRRLPVSAADDLAAIVVADEDALAGAAGVCGAELSDTGWPAAHMLILGDRPPGLSGVERHYPADMSGLAEIARIKPEFFVYAGHGDYHAKFAQLGPYLEFHGSYLTQYDLALRMRLPRNKLTILGACLAGQGVKTDSGEVSGFLRSLIAAGAGVIGMPLWSVLDIAMVDTVGELLAASRTALNPDVGVFDPVLALHRRYRRLAEASTDPDVLIEQLPISLYL